MGLGRKIRRAVKKHGGAAAGILGGATGALGTLGGGLLIDQQRRKTDANAAQATADQQTGLAGKFTDSWGQILQGVQQGANTTDLMGQLLTNFKGSAEDLEGFLQQAAPFLASAQAKEIQQSESYKHVQDSSKWDLGAMAAYGQGAGQIAQQSSRGLQKAKQGLAGAGLGRGSIQAALGQQALQGATGQQAGLFNQVYQQSQQNKMQGALQAMDAHRQISMMALGQVPTSRTDGGGGGGGGGIGGMLGGIGSGIAAGSSIGGPLGGVIGGLAGLGGGLADRNR